ncbi:hypothetical protein EYF80_034320 [Liparis tanakae]|uniref:Uncharacterized protein n=1 Tax=Liparis tanakae TaxID=230148 RepID=A0A4Z2GP55_9TELE|nr:hypothetical protein EYF80_034320 [Liparis tanakae]
MDRSRAGILAHCRQHEEGPRTTTRCITAVDVKAKPQIHCGLGTSFAYSLDRLPVTRATGLYGSAASRGAGGQRRTDVKAARDAAERPVLNMPVKPTADSSERFNLDICRASVSFRPPPSCRLVISVRFGDRTN